MTTRVVTQLLHKITKITKSIGCVASNIITRMRSGALQKKNHQKTDTHKMLAWMMRHISVFLTEVKS